MAYRVLHLKRYENERFWHWKGSEYKLTLVVNTMYPKQLIKNALTYSHCNKCNVTSNLLDHYQATLSFSKLSTQNNIYLLPLFNNLYQNRFLFLKLIFMISLVCCFCQVIKCDEGSNVWKFREFTHTIIFNKNSVKSTPLFCLTNFVIQFHEIFPSNCERIMIFSTLCKANIQRPTLKKAYYTVTIISFSINGFSQKKKKPE